MAKYEKYSSQSRAQQRPWKIHPIWRGIGCILMLIIPVLAYAGSVLLMQMNSERGWLQIPRELTQAVQIPVIGLVDQFYALAIITVLLTIIGFGLITFVYSIIYSAMGPPHLGPLDADPIRTSPRKKRYK